MFKYAAKEPLILASASPRRKELLASIGLNFSIIKPDCDETVLPSESAMAMVSRLSNLKASCITSVQPESWVLAADTTVYIDGQILGKPSDEREAFEMLSRISGRWHEVWGGITFQLGTKGIIETQAYCTKVLMRSLSKDDIKNFIATGEPMDKAGAYAIQGVGASLVSEIQGSYTNVVGLNLSAVVDFLLKHSVIT